MRVPYVFNDDRYSEHCLREPRMERDGAGPKTVATRYPSASIKVQTITSYGVKKRNLVWDGIIGGTCVYPDCVKKKKKLNSTHEDRWKPHCARAVNTRR